MISAVSTARLLAVISPIAMLAACNHTQAGVVCAPLTTVSLVRVWQSKNSSPRQSVIDDRYRIQALVDFANGRREGFSARPKGLPPATATATFYDDSQPLLSFGSGANFFSLTCGGYAGVQEANRVQIAEFQRLLSKQP